jgi:hypothetical protein
MRIGHRGASLLRTAGISTSIAGIALMSMGTLGASAAPTSDAPFTMASTPSVIQSGGDTSLKDTIVLTKHVVEATPTPSEQTSTTSVSNEVGAPLVALSTGDCDTNKDSDEDAQKDKPDADKEDVVVSNSVESTVVHVNDTKVWTATTDAVAVKLGAGDTDFHFTVTWDGLTACEDVSASKVVPTPAPTATPTAAPTAAPTATPAPVTSTTSAVSAVSAVKTPNTGGDVPTAAGAILMMSGLGMLIGGLRRRRNRL